MDYGRLNRRELQALCKEHGIPANKTNAFMAKALGTLLNAPKESDQSLQPVSDPAEVVKGKAKRTTMEKSVADVLEASEVDDLSSQLAKSTLVADSSELGPFAEVMTEDPSELRRGPGIVAEAVQVPRRARTHTSKANTKSVISLDDATPALVEPTLEVVLQVEDPTDSFAPAVADFATDPLGCGPRIVLASRGTKVKVQEKSKGAAPTLSAAIEASVPNSEEDDDPTENFVPGEGIAFKETTIAATAVTKKPKAKGKRSKKVKAVSAISVQILEDAAPPAASEINSAAAVQFPDSPMLGLACDCQDVPLRAVSLSPAPALSPAPEDGAFEFKPVPASFVEIMTPGKPLVEASKGCQHRIGRKSAKSCKSCISEKKVDSLIKEVRVLQVIVDTTPIAVCETEKVEVVSTPVKQGDNKENSLKNIELGCMSIRKLQKEVKRRGLAKRNTTRSVGAEIVQQ